MIFCYLIMFTGFCYCTKNNRKNRCSKNEDIELIHCKLLDLVELLESVKKLID